MQKFNRLKILPGLSLIEVMISLAVLGLLAVALISTTLITQKSARTAKADTQAAKLVQEYIEQIRIYRDRVHFKATDNSSCSTINTSDADPANWFLEGCSDPNGKKVTLDKVDFYRKLEVKTPDVTVPNRDKQKEIKVTVTWADSSGEQKRESIIFLACDINRSSTCP